MVICWRRWRASLWFMALVTGVVLGVPRGAVAALEVSVVTEVSRDDYGRVEVTGLDAGVLAALREDSPEQSQWLSMFAVHLVSGAADGGGDDVPAIAGRYQLVAEGVRFSPAFAPLPGYSYRVHLRFAGSAPQVEEFTLPRPSPGARANVAVDQVYPSGSSLPENTLRLYVHFSRPMARGQVATKIQLLDEHNEVIDGAFIVGPLGELWGPQQRRLTLLLDPGRIKQGVGPNRILGPALETGGERTLMIAADFKDAEGGKLGSDFRQTYAVGDAIRAAVTPQLWHITPPPSASQLPLQIRFTRSLDSAMLAHSIQVYSHEGVPIKGSIRVLESETLWQFVPASPWLAQGYFIRVATHLEDVAGNNVLAPMDVELASFEPQHFAPHLDLSFTPMD